MTHIDDLPDALLEKIFGKLPLWAQWEARGVCKPWKLKLSSIKTRAKEAWILVGCSGLRSFLLWYNVTQNRWVKKMEVARLPSPMNRPDTIFADCVFQELLLFVSHSGLISCWNAVTNESRDLVQDEPSSGFPLLDEQYGVCSDETTGEIKVFLYASTVSPLGQLWSCVVPVASTGESWKESDSFANLTSVNQLRESFANFNNLTFSNRVIPVNDNFGLVCLYDVDKDVIETLVDSGNEIAWDWEGRLFQLEEHGSFAMSCTGFGPMVRLMVSRYDPEKREFEIVNQSPEGVVESMVAEFGGPPSSYWFSFCSDGVENIWALHVRCSRMLRYNIVSKAWSTLPSVIVPEHMSALYTTF